LIFCQTITITSNFTCSHYFGLYLAEVDYLIENNANNNGYEVPIYVARRTNPGVVDIFNATVCNPSHPEEREH
jgi:hypothetical protein